jgi:hypothetical protein
MTILKQSQHLNSAQLFSHRDLAPEEYAVLLIELLSSTLCLHWSTFRQWQQRQN